MAVLVEVVEVVGLEVAVVVLAEEEHPREVIMNQLRMFDCHMMLIYTWVRSRRWI